MRQSNGCIVKRSSEGTRFFEVDSGYSEFCNSPSQAGGLNPELQRHSVTGNGDVQVRQSTDSVGFETTEGIGDTQSKLFVQAGRDPGVDLAPLRRGETVSGEFAEGSAIRKPCLQGRIRRR